MIVTHEIRIDLLRPGIEPRIHAAQDDKYSRNLKILLFAAGVPWVIPEGISVLVRYRKPDGTGGIYDTLPDGSAASSMTENAVTVALAPQVLTVAGPVSLTVTMIKGNQQLTTFPTLVQVTPSASANLEDSEDYFNVTGFLPAPISAAVGQYLVVEEVDADGRITKVKAVEAPSGGSDSSQKGGYVAQNTEPEDTSVIWIDTSDDGDDGLQDALDDLEAELKAYVDEAIAGIANNCSIPSAGIPADSTMLTPMDIIKEGV